MENSIRKIAPGERVGPYSVDSQLGEGGMGEVYLAHDTRLGRRVALKFLPSSLREDRERLLRFQQEARAASTLNHPNVATIYEIGETNDLTFIAMEFIEGVTLEEKVSGQPLPAAAVIDIAIQVADALDEAHSHGVIHRDIKAANIMITKRDRAKVLDFGLAKVTQDSTPAQTDLPTAVRTNPGLVMGTVQYMSPEQAVGQPVDARSDIWSLGIVVYEMVTGRKPFTGGSTAEIIEKIRHSEPEAIARFNYEVPGELERIVRKCVQKDAGSRYQTARELLVDLKNLRRDLTSGLEGKTHPKLQQRSTLRNNVVIAIGVTLLLVAIGVAYYLGGGLNKSANETPASRQIKSIAVLPFKPLVEGSRDETLELGMADTLISRLSNLRNVDVRPIGAVRKYASLEQDAIAAGRDQQVDAVLDGVIQRAGNQIRVSVRFIRVSDGSQLFSGQFQESITEIFTVQDSISERVASALALTLAGSERQQLTKRPTENTEAYELYLKGRFQLSRLTDDGFLKARDYFQEAIARDPNYALAHAALGEAYLTLGGWNVATPHEAFPHAREAALKALRLDPYLAESHATLGMVSFSYDWDWRTAEQEFRRAIDLNPNSSDAHQWYGYYLAAMGRFEDSLAQMQRAKDLDPASLAKVSSIGEILNFMGRTDEALRQFEKALEMDPNSGFAHWSIGNVYVHKRMYEQAITKYKLAIPLSGDSPDEPATLAYAYAKSGKKDLALQTIKELAKRSENSYVPSTLIAATYAALGNHQEASQWLINAIKQRDGILVYINIDPIFADLHSDSRHAEILRRIGLPALKKNP